MCRALRQGRLLAMVPPSLSTIASVASRRVLPPRREAFTEQSLLDLLAEVGSRDFRPTTCGLLRSRRAISRRGRCAAFFELPKARLTSGGYGATGKTRHRLLQVLHGVRSQIGREQVSQEQRRGASRARPPIVLRRQTAKYLATRMGGNFFGVVNADNSTVGARNAVVDKDNKPDGIESVPSSLGVYDWPVCLRLFQVRVVARPILLLHKERNDGIHCRVWRPFRLDTWFPVLLENAGRFPTHPRSAQALTVLQRRRGGTRSEFGLPWGYRETPEWRIETRESRVRADDATW